VDLQQQGFHGLVQAQADHRRGRTGIVDRDAYIAQRMTLCEVADHRLPDAAEALRGGDDAHRHRAVQRRRFQQDFQVARGQHADQHRIARNCTAVRPSNR
jgi:hypothetical protein